MDSVHVSLSLEGPDLGALFAAGAERLGLHANPPAQLRVDDEEQHPTGDWEPRLLQGCQRSVEAFVDRDGRQSVRLERGQSVKLWLDLEPRSEVLDGLLQALPFTVATLATLHLDWYEASGYYAAPTFGCLHLPLGFGCAFKGTGHDHLPTRRWLEQGPWRLRSASGDVSIVQFHDFRADSKTALAQARIGHERMAGDREGGFIRPTHRYDHRIEGLYLPGERKLKVVVLGREVTPSEMRDAVALVRYQALGPDRPLNSLAYVFLEEEAGRRHLHELWLRGLECWALVRGREQRFDTDYRPANTSPAWVGQPDW